MYVLGEKKGQNFAYDNSLTAVAKNKKLEINLIISYLKNIYKNERKLDMSQFFIKSLEFNKPNSKR